MAGRPISLRLPATRFTARSDTSRS